MTRERGGSLKLLVPWWIRELPADLAAGVVLVVLTNLTVFVPILRESMLRVVVGLLFVLFLPGYALLAALFPERAHSRGTDDVGGDAGPDQRQGIDGVERLALSVCLSIAVVPLIGLALNFTPWGIKLGPIMVATGGLSLVGIGIAADRRWSLPRDRRFRVPYLSWMHTARRELLAPPTRTDAALNVVLLLSVLLAVSSVAYAAFVPTTGEQFTEFSVLTEDKTGELVAADYPMAFERGEARSAVLDVRNQEHKPVTYTVVVAIHRVDFQRAQPEGPTANVTDLSVIERRTLDRREVSLAHNETWQRQYNIRPQIVGENLRLTFLLYQGNAPTLPTVEDADRELHLWVNVTDTG